MPLRRRAVTGKPARSDPRPDPRPDPARKPDNQPRQARRGVTLGWPGFTPPSWPVFPPPLTADQPILPEHSIFEVPNILLADNLDHLILQRLFLIWVN